MCYLRKIIISLVGILINIVYFMPSVISKNNLPIFVNLNS